MIDCEVFPIVHRDIKPANIMLVYDHVTNSYQCKLIDFGLSRLVAEGIPKDLLLISFPHTPFVFFFLIFKKHFCVLFSQFMCALLFQRTPLHDLET
jgi:serine/threonine protein kinase